MILSYSFYVYYFSRINKNLQNIIMYEKIGMI